MSLGELDQDDADLGPTSRFGVRPEAVRAWLDEMPAVLGMDELVEPCRAEIGARNEKEPGGITGFVLIAQGPLSMHPSPRRSLLSADLFTCPDHLDHERKRASLITPFELGDVESELILRGTRYPPVDLDGPGLTGTLGSG
jgi:S-adenosylmethionine decarboxylase